MSDQRQRRAPLQSTYGQINKIDPEAAYQELIAAGDDWADAKATLSAAEHHKEFCYETVFKELGNVTKGEKHKPLSGDDRKAMARTNQRYVDACKGLVDAERDEIRRRVRWIAAQTRLDFIRTAESTQRALLKNIDKERG